jgi:hypothetical protein
VSPISAHRPRLAVLRRTAPTPSGAVQAHARWSAAVLIALAAVLLSAQPAGAAPQVSLMPRAGAPARTATLWGVGFPRATPVRIRVGKAVNRVRTGRRGRFVAAIRLPGRARPVVVRAGGVRRVVPRFLVRSVTLQASVTVGPRARRVALYPFSAPAGSVCAPFAASAGPDGRA